MTFRVSHLASSDVVWDCCLHQVTRGVDVAGLSFQETYVFTIYRISFISSYIWHIDTICTRKTIWRIFLNPKLNKFPMLSVSFLPFLPSSVSPSSLPSFSFVNMSEICQTLIRTCHTIQETHKFPIEITKELTERRTLQCVFQNIRASLQPVSQNLDQIHNEKRKECKSLGYCRLMVEP